MSHSLSQDSMLLAIFIRADYVCKSVASKRASITPTTTLDPRQQPKPQLDPEYSSRIEMAEALGIASGAAGLLSLAIEVTKLSYTYIASVRGAPKSLTSYIAELTTLTSVLLQLEDLIQAKGFNSQNIQALSKALHDCQREIEHLRAKLEKKLSYGRIKAKVAALAWPLSESELLDKVNMLHRYNSIFSSALQADNLTVAVATNKELRDIRQSTEVKEIIAWYKSDAAIEASTSHLDDYCPSTWQTFLSGSFYQSWRSGSTPVVWGYGQPGAGKTVLAQLEDTNSIHNSALVLRHVKSENFLGATIASQFFSSSRPKETVSNFLRSLIAKALRGCPVIPQEASALYEKGSQNLMMTDLTNVLGAIAKSVTTCIILDALDECPFLPKLFNILSTLQDLGVRIFAAARDLPKIRKHFEKRPRVEISATRHDLDFYVNYRLEHGEVDVESIGPELKSAIVTAIVKRAAGSFLLARLIMDHISSLLTIKEIRKALISLPANYDEAYLSTFDRIVKQTPSLRDLALKSLNFISYVKEPLRMVELQHALIAEEGMAEVDPEDLQPAKAIISSCLGLLVVSGPEKIVQLVHSTAQSFLQSRPEGMDKRPHLTIVRSCISYMSTNEMRQGCIEILLRSGASPDLPDLAGWTPTFWAAFKGQTDIIEMLWRYDKAPFRCDNKGLTPLHWAVSAGQSEIVKRLLNLKTRFKRYERSPVLSLPSLDELTVERARAMTTRANESPFKLYSDGTDIEMFSSIFSALKQSFREREDKPPERNEGYYTFDPFLYGPFGQSLKADHGRRARPDRDYQWGKPDVGFLEFVDKLLIHAVRSQDLPIIKLAFDLKLVKASGIDSLALLHEAAATGWVEGMAALIGLGADVNNAERSYKQTPLHRACQNQREEAVKLLLGIDKIDINAQARNGGASISIQDAEGNWLMHYALRTCNGTTVQMLCTTGLSIESPNKKGQLPLHWMAQWKYFDFRKDVTPDQVQAVREKRTDCMKLVFQLSSPSFLDSMCDWEDGATACRQTPLSLALKSHNWDLVAELLKHIKQPANMSSLLDPYHNSLHELCRVSERLPSVSTPGSRDRTMVYYELQPLPFDDWTRTLQLLLDAGVNINTVDWKGNTPLQLCVQRAASIPVIDTMLKLGASLYEAGKDGLDCFQLALLYSDEVGSWDIMGCLRTYANTHPDPIHYFCQGGFLIAADTPIDNEETRYLQVLRQTGAINCETRSGRTLIYEAASRGNTRLVQRLLEHDAYPHYTDDFGSSALHAAAKQQAPTTVAVLLQAGADVHHASVDECGSTLTGTPLHVCLEACNGAKIKSEAVETVRILLSYGADPNYAVVRDDHIETCLSLCLKALCRSIYYPKLDAIQSEGSDDPVLEVLKLLVDAGARVAESADDIIVGTVAKMEGHESLWETMRSQLMPHRLSSLGAE
ncbi:related to ankyrin [Fusarium fujikuroi]|nr:related to ankyrin [Fusarium fujikuroi]SCO09728.1 related to ankyrin [Fusarium fujikuroi]SCO11723.1 related to ankyrin [Fusarium fujikuroi]SCV55663.1 related to ankyrin [Fusarium fujikuroi]